MDFYLTVLLSASLCAAADAKFAYEKGSCDTSIFSVVKGLFKNEMRALLDPSLRYSELKRVTYELYTPHNPHERQLLKAGDTALLSSSNFNGNWPVRISIHGWTGTSTSCSNAAIKDAYLARGNYNVIIVDWSEHAFDISYVRVSKQFFQLAKHLVKFLNFLHYVAGVPYESIYLIGHSAGCHISGFAGKILQPNRLGAIIALDPAGLTQLDKEEHDRLAPSDALYVESIHTDITGLGNPSIELSHASFFPNWGRGQPHCPNSTAAELDFACDHFAAMYYFAESVRYPKMFGALQCGSASNVVGGARAQKFNCGYAPNAVYSAEVFMGGEPAVPKSGIYYLSTQPRPPYGYGQVVHMQQPVQPNLLRKRGAFGTFV